MNLEQAIYMVNANAFINNDLTDKSGLLLTDRCPECGETAEDDPVFEWTHGVIPSDTGQIVVIGCEGYWVIDPNRLGYHKPDWSPIAT